MDTSVLAHHILFSIPGSIVARGALLGLPFLTRAELFSRVGERSSETAVSALVEEDQANKWMKLGHVCRIHDHCVRPKNGDADVGKRRCADGAGTGKRRSPPLISTRPVV